MSGPTRPHADVMAAVKAHDIERLRSLLSSDPSCAAARDSNGLSALMLAVYQNDADAARLLVAHRSELDAFEAAAVGLTDVLAEILTNDPAAARAWSSDGFTALHLAAHFNHSDAVDVLIQAGSDLTAVSRNGLTVMPLHSAVAGRAFEAAKLLLQAGAPPNAAQGGGWVPLMSAAQHGDRRSAELLLSCGADPSVRNDRGQSAADLANQAGHPELAVWIANR